MSASSGGVSSKTGAPKRGAHFSDKQIAQTVKDGRRVHIRVTDVDQVSGWVFGSDDYHWGLVDSAGAVWLVHKSAPLVQVTDDLLEDEAAHVREQVEPVVCGFRDYVMKTHFKTVVSP